MRHLHGSARQAFAVTAVLVGAAAAASAATSFSNSLTGFTGDSNLAPTQTAVTAAGFSFYSTDGFVDLGDPATNTDDTVAFDASGAHFGSLLAGDNGRNYMRTTQEDFATTTFTAEITFVAPDLKNQDAFFGLGTGDRALFGWPDWSTRFSSVVILPEITDSDVSQLTTFRTQDDVNLFANTPSPTMGNGTHRLRLAFDPTAKTAIFSVDVNYAGGAFVADVTAATVDVSTLFGTTTPELGDVGWPDEPSRLYFGGDDDVVFKDFSVTVGSALPGDFDHNTLIDGGDALVLQQQLGPGGLTAADLQVFKDNFPAPAAGIGAVPEPTTAVGAAVLMACYGIRRRSRVTVV